jgi:hypothetical protein
MCSMGEHGWLEIHPVTKIKVLPPQALQKKS